MITDLINSLYEIEVKLENLSHEYSDLFKEYSGNDFSEQKELAEARLDELILSATHETASQIGFYRQDILQLTDYIKFRMRYKELSSIDLMEVIDNQFIKSEFKMKLQKTVIRNIIEYIDEVKTAWNKQFNNSSYAKFHDKYINRNSK